MNITTEIDRGVTIIHLKGALDGTTTPDVQKKIYPMLAPASRLVFDMGECTYVSSSGLRLLLNIIKQLNQTSGSAAFARLPLEIFDVMKITGFDRFFNSYTSVADALESLAKA